MSVLFRKQLKEKKACHREMKVEEKVIQQDEVQTGGWWTNEEEQVGLI